MTQNHSQFISELLPARRLHIGYRTITVERPLRNEKGRVVLGAKGKMKGKPMPDPELRDTENGERCINRILNWPA